MQRHFVKESIESGGKEDESHAATRLHFDVEVRESRGPTAGDVVEVDEDGYGALASICSKTAAVFIGEVKCVKVLEVLLGGEVPSDLDCWWRHNKS